MMIRKLILTLSALALVGTVSAQTGRTCATDEFHREQVALHPEIKAYEEKLNADLQKLMYGRVSAGAVLKGAKTTDDDTDASRTWPNDTTEYHIPVVVHIIYDYASQFSTAITDDEVYKAINRLNDYYHRRDPAISGIIPTFRPYIGNAHITFHLANKDPQGRLSRGIVRTYSYLTSGGDEAAKIDQWPPDQYLNIYLENYIGRGISNGTVLAYATFPSDYLFNPYSQGVISRADQVFANTSAGNLFTLAHEIGHFLTLYHTWNNSGKGAEEAPLTCGDDEVDDTPPTTGHFTTGCSRIYDTMCARGYMKIYDGVDAYHMFGDSSASGKNKDYPDTVNVQNIMDYSSCSSEMFTRGQVARMRATLRSAVGFRSHLKSAANLQLTGITDAAGNFLSPPDLAPTADFSANRPFVCADGNTQITFTNRSYNDTVSTVAWTFTKSNITADDNPISVLNTFNAPGWVKVSLTANGTGTGSSTITRDSAVYAADPVATNPVGYYQDFNPGGDLNKYPIFNYYGTDHRWQVVDNAGFYDNTSIRYANFDTRAAVNPSNASKSPGGNYADFFTPAFDISSFADGICNISFYSAGAFRTTMPSQMNDTLEVAASTDCGLNWRRVGLLTSGDLANNGYRTDNFKPTWMGEWQEQSIAVPAILRGELRIFFRFRFKSGTDYPNATGAAFGTGNNFYLDRFNITNTPLGVKNGIIVNLGMSVSPNPTSGAAMVRINGGDNSIADISVTDVTGKLVYSSSVARAATSTRVEIPASAIAVKGMYLVKVVTNGATETKKLVVY